MNEKQRPIDLDMLRSYFDKDFRVIKESELRQAIFKRGIIPELRAELWKFLFQFYPFNSTNKLVIIFWRLNLS